MKSHCISLITGSLLLLLGITGCPLPDQDNCQNEYEFAIPVSVTPNEQVVNHFDMNEGQSSDSYTLLPASLRATYTQESFDVSGSFAFVVVPQ